MLSMYLSSSDVFHCVKGQLTKTLQELQPLSTGGCPCTMVVDELMMQVHTYSWAKPFLGKGTELSEVWKA